MKYFVYDRANDDIRINEPEILLIKEFDILYSKERNKSPKDKKGELDLD